MKKFFKKKPAIKEDFISSLHKIRINSDVLNICPSATNSSYLGVNIAAKSILPDCTVEIPSYYSNIEWDLKSTSQFTELVAKLKFKQVIFHAYPNYYSDLIRRLKSLDPSLIIGLVYHGFFAEISGDINFSRKFAEMIELNKSDLIDKFGFVKKNMASVVARILNVPSFYVLNNQMGYLPQANPYNDGNTHIGIFVNDTFRKNIHNQVLAAYLVENSIIHLNNKSEFSYLPNQNRLVEHGRLDHVAFLNTLGRMTINLHVTFSESWGGQVFTESLGMGIPCLTADTNGYLEDDPYLYQKLTAQKMDDPFEIQKVIQDVLLDINTIGPKCLKYSANQKIKFDQHLSTFLAFKTSHS